MSEKVGFGIIGLGSIAETHYKAITNGEHTKLVAVYDAVPGKAESFSKRFGGKPYDKFEDFLADPEVQAVSIGTPSGFHLDPALAAIKAGKHVLIEKPIEITPERADQIIKAAAENNVLVTGIFQSRFYEAPRLIKKAVDEGRFGNIAIINAEVKWWRDQAYYDSGAWRGTWKVDGGGALMNQSIHAIDLLAWFGGDVEEVSAYTTLRSHERIEVEDTGVAVLKFKSGALGVIEGTTAIYPGFLKKLEVLGSDGSAVLEEESLTTWTFRNETEEDEKIRESFKESGSSGGAADPKAINNKGHEMQFDDFALAIIEGRAPYISGKSASKAVQIINAIYRSAKEGKSVTL